MKELTRQLEHIFSLKEFLKLVFIIIIFLVSCYKGLGQEITNTTNPSTTLSVESLNSFPSLEIFSSKGKAIDDSTINKF